MQASRARVDGRNSGLVIDKEQQEKNYVTVENRFFKSVVIKKGGGARWQSVGWENRKAPRDIEHQSGRWPQGNDEIG